MLPFARLPFVLRRRDRVEAVVLDERLRLEPRLPPERLPDDFVPWAIFLASLSLPCGHGSFSRPEPELSYPEGGFACVHTPLNGDLHAPTLFSGNLRGMNQAKGKPSGAGSILCGQSGFDEARSMGGSH